MCSGLRLLRIYTNNQDKSKSNGISSSRLSCEEEGITSQALVRRAIGDRFSAYAEGVSMSEMSMTSSS